MEGGVLDADASAFNTCLTVSWKNPYVLLVTLSAGIGGFLFGYDTGVISGALLYIRDEFEEVDKRTWLQELIVSMAIGGAIIGAALGGWLSDRFGRKVTLLLADALFFVGALIMAGAPNPVILIIGRLFVGLGIGMASMTAPLYISEASPTKIRGALVSLNGFLITGGQFLSYVINLGFTEVRGTWRWMLGVAACPAIIQFVLMTLLPESPRWLYRKGKEEEGEKILRRIYRSDEVEQEIQSLQDSVNAETKEKATEGKFTMATMFKDKAVKRGLSAGMGSLVFQQIVGINTIMYYSPVIFQLAGFASNKTALLLSIITAGLNAFGSIISVCFIDKVGRKKLMIISLVGVVASLILLTFIFQEAETHSPRISTIDTLHFNNTCPQYRNAAKSEEWDCMTCLERNCGFCASKPQKLSPGACLISKDITKQQCHGERRSWYTKGCPSKVGWAAIIGLAGYIMFFAPGMGSVPWVINSEIYPLKYRGVCAGMASTATWITNLVVTQSFLSLTETIGTSWTFLLFGILALIAIIYITIVVPETKGLQMEEIENMLEHRPVHVKFWQKSEV